MEISEVRTSHSWTSAMRRLATTRWPSPSRNSASARGIVLTSQRPWADRRETVVQTVPDLDRDRDGPRIEAPRRLSGDVVVGPAFCARSQGGLDRLIQPVAEVALKLRGVGRRDTRRPLLTEPVDAECQQLVPLALALALPSTPIRQEELDFLTKLVAGTVEVVQSGRVERSRRSDRRSRRHEVVQQPEAHMVKSDGTPVTVYVNKQFEIVSVESGMPAYPALLPAARTAIRTEQARKSASSGSPTAEASPVQTRARSVPD
jgi:hypothetical protein